MLPATDRIPIAERVLLRFCRRPDAPEYAGGTLMTSEQTALDFIRKTVPGFLDEVTSRDVLDFGCGHGLQALALARSGARRVVGLDLPRDGLRRSWERFEALGLPNLAFTTEALTQERFDVVISCSSFEHFADPERMLASMRGYLRERGKIIITFAEPWLSPRGSHMDGFTRLPWVNVLFSERTVMRVRLRFRTDGAMRYEDVEGGLNRMTVRRFERIVRGSGMRVEQFNLFPVKGVPLVHRVPGVREFLTSAASCVLTQP